MRRERQAALAARSIQDLTSIFAGDGISILRSIRPNHGESATLRASLGRWIGLVVEMVSQSGRKPLVAALRKFTYAQRRRADTIRFDSIFRSKEHAIAKQQNTIAKKIREQEKKRKSNDKRLKRQARKDSKPAQPE